MSSLDADAQERAKNALALFEHLGITSDDWNTLDDDSPILDNDETLIMKLLFHSPRIDLIDIERWAAEQVEFDEVLDSPMAYRAKTIRLWGYVRSIERVNVPQDQRQRFQFDHYFRIHFQVDGQLEPAIVFCRQIPKRWAIGTVKHAGGFRSAINAFFLKVANMADKSVPIFVAHRAAWYPQAVNVDLGIHADHRTLGVLEMDVSLFDEVKHQQKISHHDRECFYQLLSSVGRLQSVNLEDIARKEFDIVKLLGAPATQVGLAFQVTGTARRAVRILVNDSDIRQRFGIEHYFEIEVFVSLPQHLKLVDDETGQSETYVDYPFVFCVRSLPVGLQEGSAINYPVEISGFFMKLWAFRNERLKRLENGNGEDSSARQTAPLFIGLPPSVITRQDAPGRNETAGLWVGISFVALLLFVFASLCWYSQQDKRFHRALRKSDNIDLTNLEK